MLLSVISRANIIKIFICRYMQSLISRKCTYMLLSVKMFLWQISYKCTYVLLSYPRTSRNYYVKFMQKLRSYCSCKYQVGSLIALGNIKSTELMFLQISCLQSNCFCKYQISSHQSYCSCKYQVCRIIAIANIKSAELLFLQKPSQC